MRVIVDGLEVLFPYDYIYPEQYRYMQQLKTSLDTQNGHCLLEMPTGTGKTVTLLSLIMAYQEQQPEVGKLVYCTRTVQEMDKVVEELRRVMKYRDDVAMRRAAETKVAVDRATIPGADASGEPAPVRRFLGVCLSSRRNLCIHPDVATFDNRDKVDALCRNKTAAFVREKAAKAPGSIELCDYYEGYTREASDAALHGIYSLDDLQTLGEERKWCPYFLARHLINLANVVVYNYQYMLDPKISNLVSREIERESIVVFDEAHNIDNVCIEALSVLLDRQTVHSSRQNIKKLKKAVQKMEETDSKRLNDEYKNLVRGLAQSGALGPAANADDVLANPALSDDVLQEAVPGNIRRARNFVNFLQTFVEYLGRRLKGQEVQSQSPTTFVQDFQKSTHMVQQTRALKFSHDRLSSLLRTLEITDVDEYTPLQMVSNFATLVATYSEGFTVLFEPYNTQFQGISDPLLQLCCLDASLAIKPVFERFRNVIITSGTLSPLDMYPKMLNFQPKVTESLPMTLSRNCICPIIVTKGNNQVPITSKYDQREDKTVISNYGQLLVDMAEVVPDGMVCFFTSYRYMEETISHWEKLGILAKALKHKLVFIETKDIQETSYALRSFKKACDTGRGAIFLSVARGKVAEGIDFDGHYGRCVMLFGIPFQYTLSRVLDARLKYLKERFGIQEADYLSFDAMRQASQCVGRVIRSKQDYGMMIFADVRYGKNSKLSKVPQWITQYLEAGNKSLSTDQAVVIAKQFLREMAQPRSMANDIGHAMLGEQHLQKLYARLGASSNAQPK